MLFETSLLHVWCSSLPSHLITVAHRFRLKLRISVKIRLMQVTGFGYRKSVNAGGKYPQQEPFAVDFHLRFHGTSFESPAWVIPSVGWLVTRDCEKKSRINRQCLRRDKKRAVVIDFFLSLNDVRKLIGATAFARKQNNNGLQYAQNTAN